MEAVVLSRAMTATIAALNMAGNIAPIPGTQLIGQVLQAIQDAVQQAKTHREDCHLLSVKCQTLADAFREQEERIGGTGLPPAINDVLAVLEDALETITKYATYGRLQSIWQSSNIKKDLDKTAEAVDLAIEKFTTHEATNILGKVMETKKNNQEQIATLNKLVDFLEQSKSAKAKSDEQVTELLETGAKSLHKLQEDMHKHDSELEIDGVRVGRTQFNVVYEDIVKCLNNIRRETGRSLEVTNLGRDVWKHPQSQPVEGGTLADLYKGYYLQDTVVMVKCLRGLRNASDAAKTKVLNQVKVWSHLKHRHVQVFLGITDTCGPSVALVSHFQENGNITRYMSHRPKTNVFHLLGGAADGLIYLHYEKHVAHGNLKGSQILIDDEIEALVTDVGMAKLMTGLAKDLSMPLATLTRQPSPRWMSPELMNEVTPPTNESDVWSFGMVMLEVFTGKPPFYEYRRNEQVLLQVASRGLRPTRPTPEETKLISDDCWKLMQDCWETEPADRPNMKDVRRRLADLEVWWEEIKSTIEEAHVSRYTGPRSRAYLYD